MIVVDAGVLYSFFVGDDPHHQEATNALTSSDDLLIVSPLVLAELDYFVLSRHGVDAELLMLTELQEGMYEIPPFGADDLRSAQRTIQQYADLRIGLTDASLLVLAARYETPRIATFDRRHFGALAMPGGGALQLLP